MKEYECNKYVTSMDAYTLKVIAEVVLVSSEQPFPLRGCRNHVKLNPYFCSILSNIALQI